jgi:hypothetical protein
VHNTLKLYAAAARRLPADGEDAVAAEALRRLGEVAVQRLPLFVQSGMRCACVLLSRRKANRFFRDSPNTQVTWRCKSAP